MPPRLLAALPSSCIAMLLLSCGSADASMPIQIEDPLYRPGQEWSFSPRPGEEGATLIVLRTEDLGPQRVIHVALRGIRLRSPAAPNGVVTEVGHLPFARAALDASGLTLLHESVPIPPYEAGYTEWRSAHGGAWTLSVAQALDAVQVGLEQGQ